MTTKTISVNTEAALDQAIQTANSLVAGDDEKIVLTQNISMSAAPTKIGLASGVDLTIAGNGHSLQGNLAVAGLTVNSGAVTLSSLGVIDFVAVGQNGQFGGGGAAGLGGGLFVGSGATVTLDDVNFFGDAATGGKGGDGYHGEILQGGPGYVVVGTNTTTIHDTLALPKGGKFTRAAGIGGGGDGGSGGGFSPVFYHPSVPTHNVSTVLYYKPGNAFFPGAMGQFGGGGGAGGGGCGHIPEPPSGTRVFAGGTKVHYKITTSGPPGHGAPGGAGGFGAGAGAAGANGNKADPATGLNFGNLGGPNGGGGGGLGAGGDVFVQSGGTLIVEGGSMTLGSATGGAGGAGGTLALYKVDGTYTDVTVSSPGGNGQGYGGGIFFQGTGAITFAPAAGQSTVIDDAIADMTGSHDASGLTGELTVTIAGAGKVTLNSANTFSGGIDLDSGALELGQDTSAGEGEIRFRNDTKLVIDGPEAPSNVIVDFASGDSIDLKDIADGALDPTTPYATDSKGDLVVTVTGKYVGFANSVQVVFAPATAGQALTGSFTALSDGAGGTLLETSVACYARGTRLLTPSGEVAVESLRVGDHVVTASGERRPVKWVGYRALDIARHPNPAVVRPVRVCAHAFGEGLPRSDLWLSPGHGVAVEGVLTPISVLVNARSVAQIDCASVEYWHVELDAHDILLAEGLPAESYLDTGNRTAFANGGAFVEAHPDFSARHWADTCLPLALEGPAVTAAKARLLARLAERGVGTTREADAHVRIDGLRIEPIRLNPTRLAFVLPSAGCDVALYSRTFVPAHTIPHSTDPRTLGLCVAALQIDGSPVALAQDEACESGWHQAEFESERFAHRWTTGVTRLPSGAQLVILDQAGAGLYWSMSDGVASALTGL